MEAQSNNKRVTSRSPTRVCDDAPMREGRARVRVAAVAAIAALGAGCGGSDAADPTTADPASPTAAVASTTAPTSPAPTSPAPTSPAPTSPAPDDPALPVGAAAAVVTTGISFGDDLDTCWAGPISTLLDALPSTLAVEPADVGAAVEVDDGQVFTGGAADLMYCELLPAEGAGDLEDLRIDMAPGPVDLADYLDEEYGLTPGDLAAGDAFAGGEVAAGCPDDCHAVWVTDELVFGVRVVGPYTADDATAALTALLPLAVTNLAAAPGRPDPTNEVWLAALLTPTDLGAGWETAGGPAVPFEPLSDTPDEYTTNVAECAGVDPTDVWTPPVAEASGQSSPLGGPDDRWAVATVYQYASADGLADPLAALAAAGSECLLAGEGAYSPPVNDAGAQRREFTLELIDTAVDGADAQLAYQVTVGYDDAGSVTRSTDSWAVLAVDDRLLTVYVHAAEPFAAEAFVELLTTLTARLG